MTQRGFIPISIILTGLAALAIVAVVAGGIHSYNSAIKRAEKAESQLADTRAKFKVFSDETGRIGKEAESKHAAELKRQQGVSNARIKSLESRDAATRAQFDRLRNAGAKPSSGSSPVPAIPDTARPADDSARDQRLLVVLQNAQEQTDRLIEIQEWLRQQAR